MQLATLKSIYRPTCALILSLASHKALLKFQSYFSFSLKTFFYFIKNVSACAGNMQNLIGKLELKSISALDCSKLIILLLAQFNNWNVYKLKLDEELNFKPRMTSICEYAGN